MKKKSKKKDGNNICQIGIASILRENHKKYDDINDQLNSIVHSKDRTDRTLIFSKETDDFFREKLKIDPEDYCKDGSDVCQKGLSSYYRSRCCYDKLSEEVHNKNNDYDYNLDKLLNRCTALKIEELDSKCSPKNSKKYDVRKQIKEEEERRQRVHNYFMKREKEWNESRRIARKKRSRSRSRSRYPLRYRRSRSPLRYSPSGW
jgi:hypothetical protein